MAAKLTTAALETLAVISYRQPMTRAQIEAVRGVNSDRALTSLIQHGLVAEVGRAQTVGLRHRPRQTFGQIRRARGIHSVASVPKIRLETGVTIGPAHTIATLASGT